MAKQTRSHGLDKRCEALGYRLIRHVPEQYATWAIIPTRREAYLGVPNLDAVQTLVKQLEDALWLEFGVWLKGECSRVEIGTKYEVGCAEYFLKEVKRFSREGVVSILRRWYAPTE